MFGSKSLSQDSKRKLSNRTGMTIFILALSLFGGMYISSCLQNVGKKSKTEKTLKEIAEGFSNNDKTIIMKWARGEYLDGWGGPIILDNSNEKDYTFISKGSDGEQGTADDISASAPMPVRPSAIEAPEEKQPEKKKGWNFKFSWGK